MKKTIAALLCLALLLSLCACRRDGGKAEEKAEPVLEADVETPVYSREPISCPEPDSSFEASVAAGDSIILCQVNSKGARRLFRMDAGTLSFTTIDCQVPAMLETLDGRSDGSAVLSYRDENGALIVCEIGADNSAASHPLNLPEELAETYIFDLKAVEGGYLLTAYEAATPCIYAVDRQGALIKRSAYEKFNSLQLLRERDDSLVLACRRAEETVFKCIDGELSVSAEYSTQTHFSDFVSGGESGEVIGVLPLGKACILSLETGELRGCANLADGKIGRRGFVPLSDEVLFCIDGGQAAMWRVSDSTERVTLKLYTVSYGFDSNMYTLQRAVSDFNSGGGKYYIELVDYGVYGGQAGQMLLADLMNGKTADIYDLQSIGAEACYKNNLLCDLKPWYDADPDIDYEDIVPALRRVTEREGRQYELVPAFSVRAMFARASVVGDGQFTVDSFASLAEEYGAERLFGTTKTGERLIIDAMRYSNDFLDERAGTCNFNSPDFIKLLEIAKTLPTSLDGTGEGDVYFGNVLLLHTWVEQLGAVGSLAEIDTLFGGDWRCVGFPNARGTGLTLTTITRLGMADNSLNKEGVWEFFKYLLGSHYQWNIEHAIPAVADIFEQYMDAQIQMGATCKLGITGLEEGLELKTPTEELKAKLLELIDDIEGINELDGAIQDMVTNEVSRYFDGAITADHAAANIQSKASIYLSEQYG